ncbi:MAG: serine/threonine protein kinase, partial [Bradymonadaceae bacterium]
MTMEMQAIDVKGHIFPPGEIIAERFKISEFIGRGPFGEVFKAQDTLIEADVALKIFHQEVIRNPLDHERFLNAARAARTLTQRNVVRLHDSGMHKEHPWVSMQHLEGLSLRKVLQMRRSKGEHFTLEELEPIVGQITLALQHVGRDSPHGNLKPENVIFLPELVKVTDSYILAATAPEVFSERLKESTYLAPELHGSDFHADGRCDVYSVGIIIGEMLFGEDYVPGGGDVQASPVAAIDALCARATAFDPSERYPSVEALSEDFATLVDTGRLLQRGSARGESSPPPPPPPPSVAPPRSGSPPPNPLHEETPRDIGEPLEEDLATTEVKRGELAAEIGDLLQTNEVQRGQLPPPP